MDEGNNKACSCKASMPINEPVLKNILPVDYEYAICSFESASDGKFSSRFRVKISTKEDAIKWLEEFSISSNTTYRKDKTFPENSQVNVFKVALHCQHNTRPRSDKPHPKHTKCPARLILTVKKTSLSRKYKSKDIHLKDFPTCVVLRHCHNHTINSADALKFRSPNPEVKENFLRMFAAGYTPSRALQVYTSDLRDLYKDKYHIAAADRGICPDIQWVYYTYYQVFKSQYGEASGEGMLVSLESMINKYNMENNGKYSAIETFPDGNFVVVIITPLMKRVLQCVPEAKEVLFTDSTGNVDRYGCKVFILLTNSCCGGLPVGTIITTSEREEVLSHALDMYKAFLDKESFGNRGILGPKVIMSDDSKSERNSFGKAFPEAVLLLCIFHVLQACWRYLCSSNSGVPLERRQEIFFRVKKLVYASQEEDLEKLFQDLIQHSADNSKVTNYLKNLYSRRKEWAVCFRGQLVLRGQNTNNISEAAVRVLKDSVLLRRKAYSVVQLFDFIISDLNNFYYSKLIAISNGRPPAYLKKRVNFDEEFKKLTARQLSPTQFAIHNTQSNGNYIVDAEIGICSCPVGQTGVMCKHQCFVAAKFKIDLSMSPMITDSDIRKTLLYVATGTSDVSSEWFAPLQLGDVSKAASKSGVEENAITDEIFSAEEECTGDNVHDAVPAEELEILHNLKRVFSDIEGKVKGNIELLHAAKKLISSYDKIHSETMLVSALSTFGKYSGFTGARNRKQKLVSSKSIGVQPTAMARRKTPCGGRFSLQSGRPPKRSFTSEHGYSHESQKSTLMPKKKLKLSAPHNITFCSEQNISLGKTH